MWTIIEFPNIWCSCPSRTFGILQFLATLELTGIIWFSLYREYKSHRQASKPRICSSRARGTDDSPNFSDDAVEIMDLLVKSAMSHAQEMKCSQANQKSLGKTLKRQLTPEKAGAFDLVRSCIIETHGCPQKCEWAEYKFLLDWMLPVGGKETLH